MRGFRLVAACCPARGLYRQYQQLLPRSHEGTRHRRNQRRRRLRRSAYRYRERQTLLGGAYRDCHRHSPEPAGYARNRACNHLGRFFRPRKAAGPRGDRRLRIHRGRTGRGFTGPGHRGQPVPAQAPRAARVRRTHQPHTAGGIDPVGYRYSYRVRNYQHRSRRRRPARGAG